MVLDYPLNAGFFLVNIRTNVQFDGFGTIVYQGELTPTVIRHNGQGQRELHFGISGYLYRQQGEEGPWRSPLMTFCKFTIAQHLPSQRIYGSQPGAPEEVVTIHVTDDLGISRTIWLRFTLRRDYFKFIYGVRATMDAGILRTEKWMSVEPSGPRGI